MKTKTEEVLRTARDSKRVSDIQEEQMHIIPAQPKPKRNLIELFKKIPLLSGLFKHMGRTGQTLFSLVELQGNASQAIKSAGAGFQFAQLAFVAIDFLRIPLLYVAAACTNEKLPFKLTKAAQWLYSAVILGLAIATIAAPILALPLGLTVAGIVIIESLFTLGRMIRKHFAAKKELLAIEDRIVLRTDQLKALHEKTIKLENQLGLEEYKDDEEFKRQLAQVTKDFNALRDKLQNDHDQKAQCEHRIKKMNVTAIVDKLSGVLFAAVALTGLVVSVFFPPIGLMMLAGGAVAGCAYLLTRITMHLLQKKSTAEVPAPQNKKPIVVTTETSEPSSLENNNDEQATKINAPISPQKTDAPVQKVDPLPHDSTVVALELLHVASKNASTIASRSSDSKPHSASEDVDVQAADDEENQDDVAPKHDKIYGLSILD